MSDETLRELERRFRETGALADEAQWLRECERAGLLDRAQLEVASCLEHAGARAVLELGEPRPAVLWEGLELWNDEVGVRVALALFEDRFQVSSHLGPGQVADIVREWLDRPDQGEAYRAWEIAQRLQPPPGAFNPTGTRDDDDVACAYEEWDRTHPLEAAAEDLARSIHPGAPSGVVAVQMARRLFPELDRARALVRERVAPWVLEAGQRGRFRKRRWSLVETEDQPAPGRELSPGATELDRRLREGRLSREAAELLAYLEDGAAVELLRPRPAPPGPGPSPQTLAHAKTPDAEAALRAAFAMAHWFRGLAPAGHEACVRAAVAVARALEKTWRREGAARRLLWKKPERPVEGARAIAAAEDWVLCPCDEHSRRAEAVEVRPSFAPNAPPSLFELLTRAPRLAAERHGGEKPPAHELAERLGSGISDAVYRLWEQVGDGAPAVVKGEVRADLAPWARGERDPLHERASARDAKRG